MGSRLYSVRMRASRGAEHISGAERIVGEADVARVAGELVARAKAHGRGVPYSITVTVELLAGKKIRRLAALPVTTVEVGSFLRGRETAVAELVRAGVSRAAALAALSAITAGPSPGGGNMRGAMVVDAATGRRLEPNPARGVRARSVDYDAKAPGAPNKAHLAEALALATKVASAPHAVAELCISDDPGYVIGYVASSRHGYVRITRMKKKGDPSGGRAFFVDTGKFDMDGYIRYMKEVPVLVTNRAGR